MMESAEPTSDSMEKLSQETLPAAGPPSAPPSALLVATTKRSQDASLIVRCIRGFLLIIILGLCFVLFKIGFSEELFDGGEEYTGLLDLELDTTEFNTTTATASDYPQHTSPSDGKKLLYIVTSSSQFNNKRKRHMNHQNIDRLKNLIVPVLKESIESMIEAGFEVDLYLVLAYELNSTRQAIVQEALPAGVNIQVWNDATPIDYDDGYRNRAKPNKVKDISRALARQHRFVVRDKLYDYDLFASFEDDMFITGDHIKHHLYMSKLIEDYQAESPVSVPQRQYGVDSKDIWFGDMTKQQFPRMRPGFIRVEVLLDEVEAPPQAEADIENVPIDHDFSDLGYTDLQSLDPSTCCHVAGHIGGMGATAPMQPNASQLMAWETGISGLAVRQMPDGSWVGVLPGPRKNWDNTFEYKVGSFLPNHSRTLKVKPTPSNPKFIAQSAGWMATRQQLLEMHIDFCKGSFLPPFNEPSHLKDGLYMMNVEYWSGGLQMWCPNKGCNIQRVIQLDPKNFSKHLLYHTSNNKQKQIARERRVRMDHILGQLNTIRKDAMRAKDKLVASKKK